MSFSVALSFIQNLETDPDLRQQIASGKGQLNLSNICRLAEQHGFHFSRQDLRNAYRTRRIMRAAANSAKREHVARSS